MICMAGESEENPPTYEANGFQSMNIAIEVEAKAGDHEVISKEAE